MSYYLAPEVLEKKYDPSFSNLISVRVLLAQATNKELISTGRNIILCSHNKDADIWSMGVITFVMVFNTPPFWGKNDDQIY